MSERHELPAGTSPALRARFDRLSPGDQARVLARLGRANPDRAGSLHIPRRGEPRAPLTFAQQGIWFRQQLAPQSPAWNLSRTWKVSGPLDLTALDRALSELIRRHESLRTRYFVVDGEPVQEVMPATTVAIEILDAREPADSVRQAASDFRGRLAARAFDLASPMMVRAGVAVLAPDRYELTVVRHHICSDQWSSGILRRELSSVYDDLVAGREPSLADLRLQFNDYAWWESGASKSEAAAAVLAEAVETWKAMPEGSSRRRAFDHHMPAFGPGGRVTGAIDAQVVRELRALAHSHEATLFMALMAIFNAVVHRSTNQTDLVVVTPTAGRVHPDLEPLIGLFANVLPLHTDLSDDPSLLDLLGRVRDGTARILSQQHVPIQRLQAALRPGWTRARMPMSSLLFALQNLPHDDLRLTGADVQAIESGPHAVFRDLSLFTWEDADGGLILRADYRTDRVDEKTIRRMADDFVAIATRAVEAPETRLSELPTQAARPASRLPPPHWNDTAADRLDDQARLNGYRIEPGEVETVLAQCPGVSQAVVVLREDRPDDKRLVGYYVASAAGAVTRGALQAQLRQRLPRYMLPAALVELTSLPVSANGKVDRLALPRPATDRAPHDAPAPSSDAIEASLVALWSDVLDCTGIGVDDNFFDLGGHSILAATMMLRAEQTFGRAPGLSVLFEGPTIRQLAHAFRGETIQSPCMVLTWITDPASDEDRGRPPLIAMPSMFGGVDEWRTFFHGLNVDRPIYGLELLSGEAYWTEAPTMQEIAARCREVLQRDLSSPRFHLIGYSFGGRLAYELGQQLEAAGRPPDAVVILDTATASAPRKMRWRDLRSMAMNAPRWLRNELLVYGAAELARRIRNRWPFGVKARDRGVAGIFDLWRFPEGYRRRLLDSHRAFTQYQTRPTRNRVVYLRSRVRSLIHYHRADGGWGELVPASRLTVLPIPGDHGSVLHTRWRGDVASAIRQGLEQADRVAAD